MYNQAMLETTFSRFHKVLRGEMPADRLPVLEWATWWDLTVARWEREGVPPELGHAGLKAYFGLDRDAQYWLPQWRPDTPPARVAQGAPVRTPEEYAALRPYLYPDPLPIDRAAWAAACAAQQAGTAVTWITLEGFFWWPRALLGIERHLYAFYDQPALLHRINQDQADYLIRALDELCRFGTPLFMTFAEDMSYNHGPMISRALFEEFMAPYYRRVIPHVARRGILPMIDSDGGIEPLIPWFASVGLAGILPLERMAGVDVNRIRAHHPTWVMIGGFDKTVMHRGEAAMRAEFDRLLPAMRRGYFIPSVDHQTPPAVSVEDYRLYVRLLREYAERAVRTEQD